MAEVIFRVDLTLSIRTFRSLRLAIRRAPFRLSLLYKVSRCGSGREGLGETVEQGLQLAFSRLGDHLLAADGALDISPLAAQLGNDLGLERGHRVPRTLVA